jgi:serine/threonine-protein kinase RsbW
LALRGKEPVKRKARETNDRCDLTVPSQTATLKQVRRFVATAARRFGFSTDDASKIALAVDEACTNIIKHAYDFADDKIIHLSILMRDGKFEVLITDHGKPFNPDAIKLPVMKEYLSHYRHGGLGMYLMKSLMDRVEYRIRPGLKNQVSLVKFLRQAH